MTGLVFAVMHDRLGQRLMVLSLAAVVAGTTGACSDTADPATLPDVTASPSASPPPSDAGHSATSDPSVDPTAQLEAEITAFFEDYIDTVNQSWTSEEALARRREMFADSCTSCLAGYEFAREAVARDLRFDGAFSGNIDVSITATTNGNIAFTVESDTPAGRLLDSNNAVVKEFEEHLGKQVLYQARRTEGGQWILIKDEVLS